MTDCATLSVPQAAQVLGVGRVAMYRAVREGRVPALRVGQKPKLRVPRAVLDQLLADPEKFNTGGKEIRK